ncbi:MAG: hypothetical protein WA718_17210 [Terriglobales bacterium]
MNKIQISVQSSPRDIDGVGFHYGAAGQINGATPAGQNVDRVGVGSGVYSLGAPRQIESGLRITFYTQPPGSNLLAPTPNGRRENGFVTPANRIFGHGHQCQKLG